MRTGPLLVGYVGLGLGLGVGVLAPALAHAQDGAEWERPFLGALPLPDADVSVNPPEEGVALPRRRVAWLLDAETRTPVPGATLWCRPEYEDEHTIDYTAREATARADDSGRAVIDAVQEGLGYHWIAEAPGYAPTHVSPTYRPEPLMLLRRGVTASMRVLDGFGRPIAGARFDLYPGCPCGPSVTTGRTGPDGNFEFGPYRPGRWWFDLRAPTAAMDQGGPETTLGRRPWEFVLEPRWDVRGRVVDADGRPLSNVAVRPDDWPRAPRALTDADGRFRLPGSVPGAPLLVTPPGRDEPIGRVDRYGTAPFTIRLDQGGDAIAPVPTDARVTLRTAPGIEVRLTHESGWSLTLSTDDENGDRPGIAEANVQAGSYVVAPATPFEVATFPAQRFAASRDVPAVWALTGASRQPALTIRGAVPPHSSVFLAVGDDVWEMSPGDGPPRLPAARPAVVGVSPNGHYNVWFFFPVGPSEDGERTVDVALPPPHRLRLSGEHRIGGQLFCDGIEVTTVEQEDVIETYARGPMTFVYPGKWRTADEEDVPDRVFTFELGEQPADAPLVLDWDEGKVVAPKTVRVRVVAPEGVDASAVTYRVRSRTRFGDVTLHGRNPEDGVEDGVRATAPCRIIIAAPGLQPCDRTFTTAADVEHRWGSATLRLLVRDTANAPVPAIIDVDGVRHWTSGGELELGGLTAGRHDIVVVPAADGLEGCALRLVLGEAETRARTVVVPPRR